MAESRRQKGFPVGQIKGSDWAWEPGCGGVGGDGACIPAADFRYLYWEIKVNPFSRFNKFLLLHNDFFQVRADDGPAEGCDHTSGTQVAFDLLLSYKAPVNDVLDPEMVTGGITVPNDVTLPYDLEFLGSEVEGENMIPQPISSDYERKIWAVVDMYQTGHMINGLPANSRVMDTSDIDWEGHP
jgi:hypothetical protein